MRGLPWSITGRNRWGVQGAHLNPPGPILTHLHTVHMACTECLATRLNLLADRACFSQALSDDLISSYYVGWLYGGLYERLYNKVLSYPRSRRRGSSPWGSSTRRPRPNSRASRSSSPAKGKNPQGRPTLWANFKTPIGIFRRNSGPAWPTLIKVVNIITRASHCKSSTMGGAGYILNGGPRGYQVRPPRLRGVGRPKPRGDLPGSPGRACHSVQISTERAQRHVRSQLLSSMFRCILGA
jgi:hypothetical protein